MSPRPSRLTLDAHEALAVFPCQTSTTLSSVVAAGIGGDSLFGGPPREGPVSASLPERGSIVSPSFSMRGSCSLPVVIQSNSFRASRMIEAISVGLNGRLAAISARFVRLPAASIFDFDLRFLFESSCSSPRPSSPFSHCGRQLWVAASG